MDMRVIVEIQQRCKHRIYIELLRYMVRSVHEQRSQFEFLMTIEYPTTHKLSNALAVEHNVVDADRIWIYIEFIIEFSTDKSPPSFFVCYLCANEVRHVAGDLCSHNIWLQILHAVLRVNEKIKKYILRKPKRKNLFILF